MPRFELSITADYAPAWGLWEGIREIVQNALDGQDKGYRIEFEHKDNILRVTNRGLKLDSSVWLLGKSTKRNDPAARGQHGDGLKVGALALVRAGVPMWIMNGPDRWTPRLEASEHYAGERVLAIHTRKGARRDEDFSVYVEVSYPVWDQFRKRFLPFADINPGDIETVPYRGSIIFDPAFAGDIYAKGIWVCRKPDLPYGYDLQQLQLDRDRRLVDDWEFGYEAAKVWTGILDNEEADGQLYRNVYARMLVGEAVDLGKLSSYAESQHCEAIASIFEESYGKKARPVVSAEQANTLEFYGLKGVVVPQALRDLLAGHYGSFDDIVNKALKNSGAYIPRDEMTPVEQRNFDAALRILFLADVASMEELTSVVKPIEFIGDSAPLGLWMNGEEIRINRDILGSLTKTLGTIVHEVAHDAGRDGTLGHRSKQEMIWEKVSEVLIEVAGTDWLF